VLPLLVVFPAHAHPVGSRVALLWVGAFALLAAWLLHARVGRRQVLLLGPGAVLGLATLRPVAPDSDLRPWLLLWLVALGVACARAELRRALVATGLPLAVLAAGCVGVLQLSGHAPALLAAHFPWGGSSFVEGA